MATVTTPSERTRHLGHQPALDGVRGFAVLLVVLWHYPDDILGHPFPWLKAGHLGVDVFFVLSGFLITALMLNEHNRDGRISFAGFYRRRAFRLLPALAVFLLAHIVWAMLTNLPSNGLAPGTEAASEIPSVLGAQFFALNLLHRFGDYTVALGMGHLWSLSVEEQFYLVWPTITVLLLIPGRIPSMTASALATGAVMFAGHNFMWTDGGVAARWGPTVAIGVFVIAALELVRARDRRAWVLTVLAACVGAALLYRNGRYEGGSEIFGLYAGTLSRTDSLLMGAGLAFLWVDGWIPRRCPTWVALVGWVVLLWAVHTRTLGEPFFYRYGWTVVAVAAALILWGSLDSEGTAYGRVLSMPWLRAVGKVAYGLYLWHALVFIAVHHWWGDGSVLWKTFLALGITALITTGSWFLVEKPMIARKTRKPRSGESTPHDENRPDPTPTTGRTPTTAPNQPLPR